jgi:hypothetical protein
MPGDKLAASWISQVRRSNFEVAAGWPNCRCHEGCSSGEVRSGCVLRCSCDTHTRDRGIVTETVSPNGG